MTLAAGTAVSYVVGGKTRTGRVLVWLDDAAVFVSDDLVSTTQRVLTAGALKDLSPPVPAPDPIPVPPPPSPPSPDPPPVPEPPPPPPVPPSSSWPFDTPEPIMPTNLKTVTGYTGELLNPSNDIEYVNANVTWLASIHSQRTIFRDCKLARFDMGEAEDIWVIGGEVGPSGNGAHPTISSGPGSTDVPTRIVFDGVHIHGMHQGKPDDHTEGTQISGVHTLVYRNCTFTDNHVFNLFIRCWEQPIRYILIEDCTFDTTTYVGGGQAYYCLRVAGDDDAQKPTDIVIRRCSTPAGQPISVDASAVRVRIE